MRRHTLGRGTMLVCGVLALAGRPAPADDGKGDTEKPALSGTWENKDGAMKLKLEFRGKDDLKIFPHGDSLDIRIDCSYTVTKDGLVKAKITGVGGVQDVVEKVKATLPVGKEFRFKWKADGDTARLDAMEGEDLEREQLEHLKGHLEGEYAKTP